MTKWWSSFYCDEMPPMPMVLLWLVLNQAEVKLRWPKTKSQLSSMSALSCSWVVKAATARRDHGGTRILCDIHHRWFPATTSSISRFLSVWMSRSWLLSSSFGLFTVLSMYRHLVHRPVPAVCVHLC